MNMLLKVTFSFLFLIQVANAGIVERFLYPGAKGEVETPDYANRNFVDTLIEIEKKKSIILRGPKFDESFKGSIVLFFHGNAGNYFNGDYYHTQYNKILGERSVKLYSIQYPGYAGSTIKPTESSLRKAGLKAFAKLDKIYPHNKKVLLGFSLGSAVTIQVATSTKIKYDQVILNAPWKSFKKICAYNALIFQPFVCKNKKQAYKNTDLIAKIKSPVAIFHGKRDMMIPFYHGKANFEALEKADRPYKDQFFPVSTGHNKIFTKETMKLISNFML
ncbi:MAG: pimeloyl-ACP methyl ester carboxylesterase [Bacteriovoracaceae bacterium]|jgi:pimeloyl-ACP methyl ester carboxylesterase